MENVGAVWHSPQTRTNILSFSKLRDQLGKSKLGYNDEKDVFWLRTKVGKLIQFHRMPEDLYAYDPTKERPLDSPINSQDTHDDDDLDVRDEPIKELSRLVSPQDAAFLSSTDETKRFFTIRQYHQACKARQTIACIWPSNCW